MEFVITGKAFIENMWVVRADLVALAVSKGHHVSNKVWPGTDFLVTDNPAVGTCKRMDALTLGVPDISTEEFLELMGGQIELKATLEK